MPTRKSSEVISRRGSEEARGRRRSRKATGKTRRRTTSINSCSMILTIDKTRSRFRGVLIIMPVRVVESIRSDKNKVIGMVRMRAVELQDTQRNFKTNKVWSINRIIHAFPQQWFSTRKMIPGKLLEIDRV